MAVQTRPETQRHCGLRRPFRVHFSSPYLAVAGPLWRLLRTRSAVFVYLLVTHGKIRFTFPGTFCIRMAKGMQPFRGAEPRWTKGFASSRQSASMLRCRARRGPNGVTSGSLWADTGVKSACRGSLTRSKQRQVEMADSRATRTRLNSASRLVSILAAFPESSSPAAASR